jgi:hypothetical protein
MHVKTRSVGFLVEPQNQGQRFVNDLASKPLGRFSLFWPQNRWRWFSLVWYQNRQLRFGDLGLKITAAFSWFAHQSQEGFGLSVAPQNLLEDATTWDTRRDLAACFSWKQVGLGFSSLESRLVEVRRRVVHVTPSLRLRQTQVDDGRIDAMGCVGPCYLCFAVFIL